MSANERQVGGEHYRSEYQHWDFAADAELGYFEGQISKYAMRHRFKNGLQDLEKSIHFTDKLVELVITVGYPPMRRTLRPGLVEHFGRCNKLTDSEVMLLRMLLRWRSVDDLGALRKDLTFMCRQYDPAL